MPEPTIESLTLQFKAAGAVAPEGWATFALERGGGQLARFVFLRECLKGVASERDPSFLRAELELLQQYPRMPKGKHLEVLERLLSAGVSESDLAVLIGGFQQALFFHICHTIDDPEPAEPELEELSWGLFQVDADGMPIASLEGLHESIAETEPNGDGTYGQPLA